MLVRRTHRGLPTLTLVGLLAGGLACESGPSFRKERTLEGTIPLQGAGTITLISAYPSRVRGAPARADIGYRLVLAVTASTATKARTLIEAYSIEVDRTRAGILSLVAAGIEAGSAEGNLELDVPEGLAFGARVSAALSVGGVKGAIGIEDARGLSIQGAEGDLGVSASQAIEVDAKATPGSAIRITAVSSGNVALSVPANVSASALLVVEGEGQEVVIEHPAFPKPFGPQKKSYAAEVNGGLAEIQVLNRAGSIVLRARP